MGWIVKEIGPAFNVKNLVADPPKIITEDPSGKVYNLDAQYGSTSEDGVYVEAYENYSCEESEISYISVSINLLNTGEQECSVYKSNCN